jgi:outer membrane protein assembly factor BamB
VALKRKFVLHRVLLISLAVFLVIPSVGNVGQQRVTGTPNAVFVPTFSPRDMNGPFTFRLLAVEASFTCGDMKSGEYLIQALLKYTNWNNASTANYVSYIHLLSYYYLSGDPFWGVFYKGSPTKANMQSEIRNFLCQPVAGENTSASVRMLYYIGHGKDGYLDMDEHYDYKDLKDDLSSGGLGNNNCTVIMLDTCHSGSAIKDGVAEGNLTHSGWTVLCACKSGEDANGWSSCIPTDRAYPGCWGVFTGYNSTTYNNNTVLPVGFIGAMSRAKDSNNDGWISAGELFDYANDSAVQYESLEGGSQNPVRYYGIPDGDIPIIPYWVLWIQPPLPLCLPVNGLPWTWWDFPEPPEDSWTKYGHDISGKRVSYGTGPTSNSTLYFDSFNGPIVSSTAVAEGMVFIGTHSGTLDALYALDIKNGETIWRYPQTGYLQGPLGSSPAVADGVVFFGTKAPDSKLYAIDAYTGTPRWPPTPLGGGGGGGGGGILSSPAVADNLVFVGTLDGYFYCLNATSGAPVWDYPFGGPVVSSPAVADGGVFFAAGPALFAREEFNGGSLWTSPSPDGSPILSSPAVADGRVFIGATGGGGGGGGGLYAFNEMSGSLVRSSPPLGNVSSSPAVDSLNGRVIVGAGTNVLCLHETDLSPAWTSTTSGQIGLSSPAIAANGLVYIGSHDQHVYCINEITGMQMWSFLTGGPIDSSPAICGNHLFIGSGDGKVYCLGLAWPDISIVECWPSTTRARRSDAITIYCTVKNNGNTTEGFNVKCFIDYGSSDPILYEQPSKVVLNETLTLVPGQVATVSSIWDTSDSTSENLLWACVDPVTCEANTMDNYQTFGSIYVLTGGAGGGKVPYLR